MGTRVGCQDPSPSVEFWSRGLGLSAMTLVRVSNFGHGDKGPVPGPERECRILITGTRVGCHDPSPTVEF